MDEKYDDVYLVKKYDVTPKFEKYKRSICSPNFSFCSSENENKSASLSERHQSLSDDPMNLIMTERPLKN